MAPLRYAVLCVRHSVQSPEQVWCERNVQHTEVFDKHSFLIGDTTTLSPYTGGGIITQFKQPRVVRSRGLAATLLQPFTPGKPEMMFSRFDDSKYCRGITLHIALQVLWFGFVPLSTLLA